MYIYNYSLHLFLCTDRSKHAKLSREFRENVPVDFFS